LFPRLALVSLVAIVSTIGTVPAARADPAPGTARRPGMANPSRTPPASDEGADYNGDGFDDVAISSTGEDVDNKVASGSVAVLYGSGTGLQADDPEDQLWSNASPGIPEDPQVQGGFGTALAHGDFNQDGYSDLAIGMPELDVGDRQRKEAGAVMVLYGSVAGLQVASPPVQEWSQESPGVQGVFEPFDHFGQSLAVGDFNADGYLDLAVGVPQEEQGTGETTTEGAVNVLFGSPEGLQADDPDDQFWTQGSPDVNAGDPEATGYGTAVQAGDFDGDGVDDLAVSNDEEFYQVPTQVHVLYGASGGLQAVAPDDQLWTQDSPGVKGTAELDDHFGSALGAGDFNTDGYDDLAICVVNDLLTLVLYGSDTGLQARDPDDQRWSQASPHVHGDSGYDGDIDVFGTSLVVTDFNLDGFPDLAATVRNDDVVREDVGSVQVLFGSAAGLQAKSPDDQLWNQGSPDIKGGPSGGDAFGGYRHGIAVGDFDGDGVEDLAIGVPGDGEAGEATGGVNVLYGSPGVGLQAHANQYWSQDSRGVKGEAEYIDGFGGTLT
jgi:hypothetical protein